MIPWRRERLPTPVFWPGKFQELYSPWGCKEVDMTERLSLSCSLSGDSGRQTILACYSPWGHKELDMT